MSEPERPYQPVPPIKPDLSLVPFDDLVQEMKNRYTEVVVIAARTIGPDEREIQKNHQGDGLLLIGLLGVAVISILDISERSAWPNPEGV